MPPKIRYGLVGDPIEHSLSPVMHNAAFESMKMNAEYLLRPSKLEDAEAIHRELIHGRWAGLNVTTPLKTTIAGLVELQGHAARAGAVNTLWRYGDEVRGALTDVEGILTPLEHRGFAPGKTVMIIGGGGAARAAAIAADSLNCTVHVACRNPDKAREFLDSVKVENPGRTTTLSDERVVGEMMSVSDLIIQATPVGRDGDKLELPWGSVRPETLAFDMVYKPIETPFLQDAGKAGCKLVYGWEMLLWQGAHALKIFTGRLAPVDVMKEALLKELK